MNPAKFDAGQSDRVDAIRHDCVVFEVSEAKALNGKRFGNIHSAFPEDGGGGGVRSRHDPAFLTALVRRVRN